MRENSNNHTLLTILKRLYAKIAMIIVQIRLRSYHFLFESKNEFDITSVLHKQVGDLAARASKNNTPSDIVDKKKEKSNFVHGEIKIKNQQVNKTINVGDKKSEFSNHLKKRKSSSVNQPYMGDKLKISAWEHIHSAIRYARQGDVSTAKLHADIAGHALEEAGHYMDDNEYSDLVYQIENYFNESH